MKSFLQTFKQTLLIGFGLTAFIGTAIGMVALILFVSPWFWLLLPIWFAVFIALGIESLKRK